MSETGLNLTPQEQELMDKLNAPAKRRGGRPKGSKNKKVERVVTEMKDPLDRKLDHFQYHASPDEIQDWKDEKPLNSRVVRDIKKKYPGMRCRFVSSFSMDKRGKGYRGWQLFSDKSHPNGIKVGNDLFLAMMPEELAQSYNDEMAYRSTRELVKHTEQMQEMAIGSGMSGKEMERLGAPKDSQPGMTVGDKPRTKTQFGGRTIYGGGYNRTKRSLNREQFVKRMEKERTASTRAYSFAKGK
jgi:hypothetical protein